jgi:hypothetical protein
MTPDAGTQPDTSAPAAGKSEPAGAAPAPVKAAADAEEVPSFTPPSQKRVIKNAPPLPEKKARGAKKPQDPATKPEKPAKPAKAAKPAKPPKEPRPARQGPSRREAASLKARQAAKSTGRAGKRVWLWLKGMALERKGDFDQADWIAWGVGIAASLLLLAAILLMGFVRLDWILAGSDAIETQATILKGIELGVWGYVLVAISAFLILLYLLNVTAAKTKMNTRVNPAFLAICMSMIGLVVLILAIWSNGSIMHAVVDKNGWMGDTKLDYAKKTILYGSYISVACLVMVFGAAAVRLAEREASPQWIRRITSWFRVKLLTVGRSGKKDKGPDA